MDEYSIILGLQGLWEQYVQQLDSEATTGSVENEKQIWTNTGQYWRIFENTDSKIAKSREFYNARRVNLTVAQENHSRTIPTHTE